MKLQSLLFISLLLFYTSCAKDQDLFSELVLEESEDIADTISDDTGTDNNSNDAVVDNDVSSELKAFPEAYGAGAYADGYRGGTIIHVTSLEDNYQNVEEGTYRWAITRTFPRIIVFDISGTITLSGRIKLNADNSNVYVAGQTSPNGIMIKGYSHNVYNIRDAIFRHIKFYGDPNRVIAPNDASQARRPLIRFVSPIDVMVDHCDFVFNANEAMNFWSDHEKAGGATMQNCLIGEGVTGTLMGGDECNTLYGGEYSAIRNLFVHISHRHPNFTANVKGESINNVVYNSKARLSRVSCSAQANFYGNYYKAGPATFFGQPNRINLVRDNDGADVYLDEEYWSFLSGVVENNSDPHYAIFNAAVRNIAKEVQPPVSSWLRESPIDLTGIRPEIYSNEVAYENVLKNAGATRYLNNTGVFENIIDPKQEQYFNDVRNETNTNGDGSKYGFGLGIYDVPEIANSIRPNDYDTDKDGMPDLWEIANGFNPNTDDSAGDQDGDGYTNVEEFLNLVDF